MVDYKKAIEIVQKYGQEHLLSHYDSLSSANQKTLISQILSLDFNQINNLFKSKDIVKERGIVEPISYINKSELSEEALTKYSQIGINQIASGKLAVVTMAGRTRYQTRTQWSQRNLCAQNQYRT